MPWFFSRRERTLVEILRALKDLTERVSALEILLRRHMQTVSPVAAGFSGPYLAQLEALKGVQIATGGDHLDQTEKGTTGIFLPGEPLNEVGRVYTDILDPGAPNELWVEYWFWFQDPLTTDFDWDWTDGDLLDEGEYEGEGEEEGVLSKSSPNAGYSAQRFRYYAPPTAIDHLPMAPEPQIATSVFKVHSGPTLTHQGYLYRERAPDGSTMDHWILFAGYEASGANGNKVQVRRDAGLSGTWNYLWRFLNEMKLLKNDPNNQNPPHSYVQIGLYRWDPLPADWATFDAIEQVT